MSTTCSICLCSLRKTRQVRTLSCGHEFHGSCFDSWESTGSDTCPMCRRYIGKEKFKVTLTIQNLQTNRSNTVPVAFTNAIQNLVQPVDIDNQDLVEITALLEDTEGLERILSDLEIVGAIDLNSLILNAEGGTIF